MEAQKENNSSKLSQIFNKKIFTFIPLRIVFGAILGLGIGYLYYTFIGCSSNSCSIASNPWLTTSMFGLGGILLTSK